MSAAPARTKRRAQDGPPLGTNGTSLQARTPTNEPQELIVSHITKRFGSFVALQDVSLTLRPGTLHAVLGENGAGKSTLVKCIMGYHKPDEGEVLLGGKRILARTTRDAQALGLGMVYQHFTLVPNMTVAENFVLARAQLPFVVKWEEEQRALASFLAEVPFRVEPGCVVRALSAGDKQKVEILKQLYLGSSIIVLDEPTSVLTPHEADLVLDFLKARVLAGKLSILMITHKFREVTRYCDEVTVLRRGRLVARSPVLDLTPTAMAEMMMGPQEIKESQPTTRPPLGLVRLVVDGLEAEDDRGALAVRGVSLEVRSGEVVGIAAVAGNGQEQLLEVLAGQRPKRAGRLVVMGQEYFCTRAEMLRHHFRCLPEEPLRNACVPTMSVAENMAFGTFDRPPVARARIFLSHDAIRAEATRLIEDYGVRTPSDSAPIGTLSGGNVQRAVLARELSGEASVLVIQNPCMGLDFRAVAEIHARIQKARDGGAAVLLISADLDELLAVADRILVMSEGRVVYETARDRADVTHIGRFMAGHGAEEEQGTAS